MIVKASKVVTGFATVCMAFSLMPIESSHALGLVKVNKTAAQGSCLPKMKGSVSKILKANNARIYIGNNHRHGSRNKKALSHTDGRAKAVAHVLYVMDTIGHGKFNAHKGAEIIFGRAGKSSRVSRRRGNQIQLNPGGQNMRGVGSQKHGGTHNKALISHEISHLIGGYKGGKIYNEYWGNNRPCHLTGYADNNRVEEFAEVVAAYINNPAIFARMKGRMKTRCTKAFNFLKKKFGEPKLKMTCASRKGAKTSSKGVFSSSKEEKESKPAKTVKKPSKGSKYYTVKSGDSLSLIAKRHGISLSQLRKLNGIKGSTIHPGQKLKVK